jgi:type II secretory pathway component PulJ
MRPGRTRNRAGFSIVEAMAAMTVITIVMGVCLALVTMLLKLPDAAHQHATDEAARSRVARLFREDVRAASRVVSKDQGKRLSLRSGDGVSVEYAASGEGLSRVAWLGDQVAKEERLPLPPRSAARFEFRDGVVALLLDRRAVRGDDSAKSRVLRVEAAVGASLRFRPRGETSR